MFVIHKRCCSRSSGCSCLAGSSSAASRSSRPYHAYSLWGGYTLYGWATLCRDAGLILEEARPSIDAVALLTRQYEGAPPEHARWWQLSPLNVEIDEWAEATDASVLAVNARKLQFCGQFAFRVRRPPT